MERLFQILAGLGVVMVVLYAFTFKGEIDPEWKQLQRAYYGIQAESAEAKLAAATNDEDKARLRKTISQLNKAPLEIKQVVLGNGEPDRCMTCHIDTANLSKKHPDYKTYPFDDYGCAICHGGNPRAIEKHAAHEELYQGTGPIDEYVKRAKNPKDFGLNYREFNLNGARLKYVGAQRCLGCHQNRNREHVEYWVMVKFNTFERVRNNPNIEKCLPCHTTGYNPETKTYSQESVTCEACHGPGEVFMRLMAGGREKDGREIALGNVRNYNPCVKCHGSAYNHADVPEHPGSVNQSLKQNQPQKP